MPVQPVFQARAASGTKDAIRPELGHCAIVQFNTFRRRIAAKKRTAAPLHAKIIEGGSGTAKVRNVGFVKPLSKVVFVPVGVNW